jgi:hypothetical protein
MFKVLIHTGFRYKVRIISTGVLIWLVLEEGACHLFVVVAKLDLRF